MSFEVKGWCPGALRPMMSGDGLVVRIRPHLARLTAPQAIGLCQAAMRHGAGLIDMTNRANLQIRGVSETGWPAVLADLEALGLLDTDVEAETRRNIVVAPLWVEGDDTHRLTIDLLARLAELPTLPPKVGFVVDAGARPCLTDVPADFRFERADRGGVILRAAGRAMGMPLTHGVEIDTLIRLAHWFNDSGGALAGRMARHDARLPDWAGQTVSPAAPHEALRPGLHPLGPVHGLAFGQVKAADLARALTDSGAVALRVTPWRMAMLEGGAPGPHTGLLWDADAPELRVDACPGAPFCQQSSVETRSLAARLAPHVRGRLHVSGCAKGCARRTPADAVLTGNRGFFDIAHTARAGDTPVRLGQTPAQVLDYFGVT